jgi:hypothetical protein
MRRHAACRGDTEELEEKKKSLCYTWCMKEEFIRDSVQLLILTVVNDFPHDRCWVCECFQDFIERIEREGKEDAAVVIGPLKVPKEMVRTSFHCESCPPKKAVACCVPGEGAASKLSA